MLPLTSTHHFHLRGHSATARMFDGTLDINVTAPGEIVNDLEIILHGIGVEKARALGQSIVDACEKIEPAAKPTTPKANCPLETGLRPCECDLPRCPECNYTKHDAAFEGDHGLCKGRIPADGKRADDSKPPFSVSGNADMVIIDEAASIDFDKIAETLSRR